MPWTGEPFDRGVASKMIAMHIICACTGDVCMYSMDMICSQGPGNITYGILSCCSARARGRLAARWPASLRSAHKFCKDVALG